MDGGTSRCSGGGVSVFRTTLLSTLLSTAPRTLRGATTTIDGCTPEPEALNKTSTYQPAFFAATISPGTDAHPLLSVQTLVIDKRRGTA
ncbi:hypothetical protein HPB47_025247 [Ixodes persulcatus]|uniref:Uncharacterized protein n=1 Tax=Ixodes persulcatus TaxID=34615 RepID=A0AC60Q228_IXOPE|nr:hypothetical protein HPB47_025247 [Ixodes persulcatus]